jgi:hypothetical protein
MIDMNQLSRAVTGADFFGGESASSSHNEGRRVSSELNMSIRLERGGGGGGVDKEFKEIDKSSYWRVVFSVRVEDVLSKLVGENME